MPNLLSLKINDYCQYLQTNATLFQRCRAWFSSLFDVHYLGLSVGFVWPTKPINQHHHHLTFDCSKHLCCITIESSGNQSNNANRGSGKHPGKDSQVTKTAYIMLEWDGMLVPQTMQAAKFKEIQSQNCTLQMQICQMILTLKKQQDDD